MIKKINLLFVTLFGIGNLKGLTGTYASLFTTLLLFILFHFYNLNAKIFFYFLLLIILISFFAINFFIEKIENKDPKEVVIDEFIGQAIPITLYEISHEGSKEINTVLVLYMIMFILFRFFDILKPFPVSFFDKRIKNGFGVVMDDVCAGLYVVLMFIIYMVITK
tara:strand:- start:92 stop:586 length:495 start_codon:yes stop_codon:yes gene_type:complete